MTDGAPFTFVASEPPPALRRIVQSIWYARGTVGYQRERIAPTGSTVALLVFGDPIRQVPDDGHGAPCTSAEGLLIGPHDRPIINEPQGETHAVGVVTTPVGCEAVFGFRPATVRGQVVSVGSHWPTGVNLRAELMPGEDPERALATVADVLEASARPLVDGFDRCEAAVAALEADPTRPIAHVAAEVGVTHNRLDRDFNRIVGLSPRTLASLLRVRELLGRVDPTGDVDWPRLAAELGWYDQAHLVRDVKRYTGVSPTRYVEAQRVYRDDGHASDTDGGVVGFVPE